MYSESCTQKHVIEQKKIATDCFCQKEILSVCLSSHKNDQSKASVVLDETK